LGNLIFILYLYLNYGEGYYLAIDKKNKRNWIARWKETQNTTITVGNINFFIWPLIERSPIVPYIEQRTNSRLKQTTVASSIVNQLINKLMFWKILENMLASVERTATYAKTMKIKRPITVDFLCYIISLV
jgi:hypothetical protein